jgi:hypothetical protein
MGLRLSLPDRLRVLAFDAAARNKAVTLIPQRGPPQANRMRETGNPPVLGFELSHAERPLANRCLRSLSGM